MYRPKNTQEAVLHRLKIAQGHLAKVIAMVESDAYCIDVIHQSLAVQAALKKTDAVVLKNHLNSCVADSMQHGDTKAATEELMQVFRKL